MGNERKSHDDPDPLRKISGFEVRIEALYFSLAAHRRRKAAL
jgi:hypothetical protein